MSIKVGYLPLYIKLYDDATPARRPALEKYTYMLQDMIRSFDIEVVASPTCRIKPEFEAAIELFHKENVDAIVTQHEAMEQGAQTVVGSGGVRLSGGQAQRLALARTLAHPRPVLVLDDPFSALDRQTEDEVFARLKACAQDRVVILISHRLYHFPELRQIVFMQGGKADAGTHEALCASVPAYRALYESQTGGAAHEA